MARRRISEHEIEEALSGSLSDTPCKTPKERNLFGETKAGRRLRITVRATDRRFIITVVAPDEDDR